MEFTECMFENPEQYGITNGKERSCFFTGHRKIPAAHKTELLMRLKASVSYLYAKGVTDFYAGGALGFDTLAATQILDMRREHAGMRLILELPYANQCERWKESEKRIYYFLRGEADEVHYAAERDAENASDARKLLLARNRALAASSLYCISYFSGAKGGTAYTVALAEKYGCEIINLYDLDRSRDSVDA